MAFGLLLPLAAAEAVLRFLPVNTGLRTAAVSADHPVFHFEPNRDFTYSNGWAMKMANTGRVNNAGYVNDRDYRAEDPHPRLGVVGDSYIEAAMVPFRDTMHGRLSELVDTRGSVYSFAASGAPLSQYVVWAEHARKTWSVDALVINVVGNDFDESLAAYKIGPGFHHYVETGTGELELRRFDFTPNAAVRLMTHSALVRYALLNLKAAAIWELFAVHRAQATTIQTEEMPAFAGNTRATVDDRRISSSLRAIDAFLRDLAARVDLPAERILFVVDGHRVRHHGDRLSYFGRMRTLFIERARAQGHEVIDSDDAFLPYRDTHPDDLLDYGIDGHWNGVAHGLVANRVAAAKLFGTLFP